MGISAQRSRRAWLLICSGTRPGSIFHLVTAMTNTFPASVFLSFQSRSEGSRGQTMLCVSSYSAKHTFQEKVVGQGIERPRASVKSFFSSGWRLSAWPLPSTHSPDLGVVDPQCNVIYLLSHGSGSAANCWSLSLGSSETGLPKIIS